MLRDDAMTDPLTKRCPECAEDVRSEALKCRFCGYRFDLGKPAVPASRWSLALGLFKKRTFAETPSDLLSEWGVNLDLDEPVRFWAFGRVSTRHGYLVVTDRRFMIFEGTPGRRYRKLHEHPLDAVTAVDLLPNGDLQIVGTDHEVTVRGVNGQSAKAICDHISAHELVRRAQLPGA
jgi:Uncharacterised protein family UPF0547